MAEVLSRPPCLTVNGPNSEPWPLAILQSTLWFGGDGHSLFFPFFFFFFESGIQMCLWLTAVSKWFQTKREIRKINAFILYKPPAAGWLNHQYLKKTNYYFEEDEEEKKVTPLRSGFLLHPRNRRQHPAGEVAARTEDAYDDRGVKGTELSLSKTSFCKIYEDQIRWIDICSHAYFA